MSWDALLVWVLMGCDEWSPLDPHLFKNEKKSYFRYPNFGKDLGFCILVKSSQYKGEVKNSKFEKLIGLWAGK